MTPEMQAAVEWVQGLLQGSGLSQRKLGKKCGCSQTQVSYWLRGAGGITPKAFRRVCAAFGSTRRKSCASGRRSPSWRTQSKCPPYRAAGYGSTTAKPGNSARRSAASGRT